MALVLSKYGYLHGLCAAPSIPGFQIHQSADDWVMATGMKKEWIVGETETHWLLVQKMRGGPIKNKRHHGRKRRTDNQWAGKIPQFYVDHRNTLAFRK